MSRKWKLDGAVKRKGKSLFSSGQAGGRGVDRVGMESAPPWTQSHGPIFVLEPE